MALVSLVTVCTTALLIHAMDIFPVVFLIYTVDIFPMALFTIFTILALLAWPLCSLRPLCGLVWMRAP
jgi:hypothetical protein